MTSRERSLEMLRRVQAGSAQPDVDAALALAYALKDQAERHGDGELLQFADQFIATVLGGCGEPLAFAVAAAAAAVLADGRSSG